MDDGDFFAVKLPEVLVVVRDHHIILNGENLDFDSFHQENFSFDWERRVRLVVHPKPSR